MYLFSKFLKVLFLFLFVKLFIVPIDGYIVIAKHITSSPPQEIGFTCWVGECFNQKKC